MEQDLKRVEHELRNLISTHQEQELHGKDSQ